MIIIICMKYEEEKIGKNDVKFYFSFFFVVVSGCSAAAFFNSVIISQERERESFWEKVKFTA